MRGLQALVVAILVVVMTSWPALAVPAEQVIRGAHLQLTSITGEEMSSMIPGQPATWYVGAEVISPGNATVDVQLRVVDASTDAFTITVHSCAHRFVDGVCSGGATVLAAPDAQSGSSTAIDQFSTGEQPWYAITVTLTESAAQASTTLWLVASGLADEVAASTGGADGLASDGPLAWTGIDLLRQLWLALAAIVGGGLLLARAGRPAGSSPS